MPIFSAADHVYGRHLAVPLELVVQSVADARVARPHREAADQQADRLPVRPATAVAARRRGRVASHCTVAGSTVGRPARRRPTGARTARPTV